jgi:hypothetical protein
LLLLLLLLPSRLLLLLPLGPVPLSCVMWLPSLLVFWFGGRASRPRFPRPSLLQEVLPEVLLEVLLEVRGLRDLFLAGHRWNRNTRPWWPWTCAPCHGRRPCWQCVTRKSPVPPPRRESRYIPRPCTAWGMEGASPASPSLPCSVPPSWPFSFCVIMCFQTHDMPTVI